VVAIAGVIPVVTRVIKEAAAMLVIGIIAGVEWVDITHNSSRAEKLNADKYVGNTHIGERVITSLNENAYRIGSAVTNDINLEYVGIRGVAVSTVLDMNTYLGVLYGNVVNRSLSAAVDRNSVSLTVTVNDTAREIVVASDGSYIVRSVSFGVLNPILDAFCQKKLKRLLLTLEKMLRNDAGHFLFSNVGEYFF
jgi:hypothetical protein